MELFFRINGLAGRSDFADALFKSVYVLSVPLLWTALAALLLSRARRGAPQRWRVGVGALTGALLCVLLMAGVNAFAAHFLSVPSLSERPFMARRVTLLLVEPNDNSFPSPEVMLAACAACAITVAWPRRGWLTWIGVLLLMWARVFCGSNYPADVLLGAILGATCGTFGLALWRATWRLPFRDGAFRWRARHQAAFSALLTTLVLSGALWKFGAMPRYKNKIARLWGASSAQATAPAKTPQRAPLLAVQRLQSEVASGEHEGETTNSEASAPRKSARFPLGATVFGGDLRASAHLFNGLRALRLPCRLVSVDVGEVRAGTTSYRGAFVRFQMDARGPLQRRLTASTVAAIARGSLRVDSQLSNVDVAAVTFDVPMSQQNGEQPQLIGGTLPVFTASITRESAARAPFANPALDAETWLRARSLLYVDNTRLPATPLFITKAKIISTPTPGAATPSGTPSPQALLGAQQQQMQRERARRYQKWRSYQQRYRARLYQFWRYRQWRRAQGFQP